MLRGVQACGRAAIGLAAGAGVGGGIAMLSASATVRADGPPPVVKLGIVADVQYADIDDAPNFNGNSFRRYRGALDVLRSAVTHWKQQDVAFVMDLGDIIDQINETKGVSHEMLSRVLDIFSGLGPDMPVYHLIGNHELYNFTRAELTESLPGVLGRSGLSYHSFSPAPGWRMVVLDTYDQHCITDREVPPGVEGAFRTLEAHNPNNVRAKRGTTDWSKGVDGLAARFMPYNGGVGPAQLAWLRSEMEETRRRGERALVFTHVPILPGCASPRTIVWNYEEVLEALGAGNCVAVFTGHDHRGGYAQDPASGTHHVTLPSPLHATAEQPYAHGIVELHSDAVVVQGSGIVPSFRFPLTPLQASRL